MADLLHRCGRIDVGHGGAQSRCPIIGEIKLRHHQLVRDGNLLARFRLPLQRRLAIADARRAAENAEYGSDEDEGDELSPVAVASMHPKTASADHR